MTTQDSANRLPTFRRGDLKLGIPGFTYADLFEPTRLKDLHELFEREVAKADPSLFERWRAYAAAPDAPRKPTEISSLLVGVAPHVSRFIVRLFRIEREVERLAEATALQDPIFRFKIQFVRRRALARVNPAEVAAGERDELDAVVARLRTVIGNGDVEAVDEELATARAACALMDAETALATAAPHAHVGQWRRALGEATAVPDSDWVNDALRKLERWSAAHVHDPAFRDWVAFRFPNNIDYHHLVDHQRPFSDLPEAVTGPDWRLRLRDGFTLTDHRMSAREVLSEIHYCIFCHERDKDSCSKGYPAKDKLTRNPLGILLHGCPLDEKISEAHMLRKAGDAIAALCAVTLDNPMCPGTGHRICNDCMKACIYQKQDPVNIPQIETGILTDVLKLPYGVEVYGLLTRWNPLNVRRPYPLPYNGKNVLVVGLGPAGYTLAHLLLNEGFGVVGIDGLKIEPLPEEWTTGPIRQWNEIYQALDTRILEGFGGVSEYGITVRWDKNFLTLLHLTLARREKFRLYGGVRFGGTLTAEDAWGLGFDHIAIGAGAGRPTIVDVKNNLIRGVRQASDFLMALQLTGAFKDEALANLQVRLPSIVIGGGLTAIDTATELAAYYPAQVEKTLRRYETLSAEFGDAKVRAGFDEEEREILDEFLAHGREVREERRRAAAEERPPNLMQLVRKWGGVSLVYRKSMVESPAYRLNHEEIIKFLEEGVSFVECLDPVEAIPDARGHVQAVRFRGQAQVDGKWVATDREVVLPARSVLVAAGTTPNVTYEKEHPGTFELDARRKFFQPHHAERTGDGGWHLTPARGNEVGFFTSYDNGGRFITYYGDTHPEYAGSVVKAMASIRDGFPHVLKLFADEIARLAPADQPARERAWEALARKLDDELVAVVEEVVRLTPTIVEVIVRAPRAARQFHPGQFYRLQNYETQAPTLKNTRLMMEGIALTGAWAEPERGLVSLIVLEMGVSSRICALLRKGEPVIVMGPTGTPTEIPSGQNVLLAGGGLGNAVLFSIAKALRARNNRVVYFAGYKRGEDLFKREEIEAATDQVVWSTDSGAPITPHRPQDKHFRGNIVQAMLAYQRGELGEALVPLPSVDRIMAIGSDRMMAAVKAARHSVLAPYLKAHHVAIASINSPMQCMMKEVCAQCLQRHIDPVTGAETFVFSCFNQDQPQDRVDFGHLSMRLRQNTVQEKLANLLLDHLLAGEAVAAV